MSPANLFYFYRRRLRTRLVAELLAFVGLTVGVALLFATWTSNSSLSSSIGQLTQGLVGKADFQLLARGPANIDPGAVKRVAAMPGVEVAAPVLEAEANIVGPDGERAVTMLAADSRVARLEGSLLSDYSTGRFANLRALGVPTPIADRLGLKFGSTATLQLGGRSTGAPVGAVLTTRDIGALTESPVVLVPLSYGEELAGTNGGVSRVFVRAQPGQEKAARAALLRIAGTRFDVRPANFDVNLFDRAAGPNDQSTSLFAAISAAVGFLFAFNAMLLMASERRAVVAELGRIGAGVRSILMVLTIDALAVGLVASAAGLVLGDQLSRHVFPPAPGYLTLAFPVGTARVVQWQTVVLAVCAGVVASVLGALAPLVPALRGRDRGRSRRTAAWRPTR